MPRRPCIECGVLAQGTRCRGCEGVRQRARDKARGNRHQRGYDGTHDRIRATLLAHLVPGTPCPRCGQGMYRDQDLDASHPIGAGLRVDRAGRADHLSHAACNRGERTLDQHAE